jgi:hypothetical protein
MTDAIMKEAALEHSTDNLTVLIICFNNLEKYFRNNRKEEKSLF